MRRFTKYPTSYVNASTESDDIKFYEVELANVDDVDDLEPDRDDGYSICILGRRKPSIKEAEEFLAEDMKNLGYNCVVNVSEITPYEAEHFFDMTNKDKFPIFE